MRRFKSQNGFINFKCSVNDLKENHLVFRDNFFLGDEKVCGVITHVYNTVVIGANKYHLEELLTYGDVPCKVVFMTLSNFMKCMDSVKRPKKSGNEYTKSHLPTKATEVEATEGRNEAKEAEATVTNEAVGNETEAIAQSSIESVAASTSTAIETEAKLVAQPAVQSEVSSDVNSSELVNPEGNLFDVFASAKEIDIEIKTHKDHNRCQSIYFQGDTKLRSHNSVILYFSVWLYELQNERLNRFTASRVLVRFLLS